jgi:hypothetical protein
MYKCVHCPYSTNVKCNFIRHKNRKKICYKDPKCYEGMSPNGDEGMSRSYEGMSRSYEGMSCSYEGMSPKHNTATVFICSKCDKQLKCKQNLIYHENVCDGYHKRQCKTCLKMFATTHGKWKHNQNVKCYPPPLTLTADQRGDGTLEHPREERQQQAAPTQSQSNPTTVNNHGSHNTNNIQNTNNINNNTTVLMFGKEDLSKLLDNPDYMHKAATLVNSREYFLPMSVPLIYFNDEHEENKTLRKNLRNGNMVEYHIGNGVWEKRFTCDIINDIVDKSCEYISKYLEQVNIKNDIKFSQLRLFGDMLQKFKTTDTGDLEERLIKARKGMSMSSNRSFSEFSEPSSSEIKRTTKKAIALVNDKLYDETQIQKSKEKEKQNIANGLVSCGSG